MIPNPNSIPNRQRQSAGFSLVELLVVIAIIAVLGALTTVGVRGMMARAHESTCAGNMRQLGVALSSFVAEKGGYPNPNVDPAHWDRMLLPYLGDPTFDFTKGVNNPIRVGTEEAAALGSAEKILKCPADKVDPGVGQFKRSYSLCNWAINQSSGTPGGWSNGFPQITSPLQRVPPSMVTEPHRAVVMTEFWAPENGPAKHVIGSNAYSVMFGFRPMPQDSNPAFYHKTNQNILFVDGHVESIPGNMTDAEWYAKGYSPPKSPTK